MGNALRSICLAFAVGCALGSGTAAGDPIIFQSAIQQPASPGGQSVFDRQFVGARFFVTQETDTTRVGGNFTTPILDIFGAVVRLSSASDFPDSANLSTPDVLGAARLSAPGPPLGNRAENVSQALSIHLTRGWYAIVFGSGLFGTQFPSFGSSLPTQHLAVGNPRFFQSSGLDPGSVYANITFPRTQTPFLFVEGTNPSAFTPEPSTMLLVCGGLGVLMRRRRRDQWALGG